MELHVEGYASRFHEGDLGGDTVLPGAFSAALLVRPAPRPMLYAHDTANPIGVWDRIVEDDIGLFVKGRIQGGSPSSDRMIDLVRSGAVSGLSIGYRTIRSRGDGTQRELAELDLWEISIVAFPMLPSARITRIFTDPTTQPVSQPTEERIAA